MLRKIADAPNVRQAADDNSAGLTEAAVQFVKNQSTFVHKVWATRSAALSLRLFCFLPSREFITLFLERERKRCAWSNCEPSSHMQCCTQCFFVVLLFSVVCLFFFFLTTKIFSDFLS